MFKVWLAINFLFTLFFFEVNNKKTLDEFLFMLFEEIIAYSLIQAYYQLIYDYAFPKSLHYIKSRILLRIFAF